MIKKYKGGVITSDLVESSKLSIDEKDDILNDVKIIASDLLINRYYETHINVFRGDSFQIATSSPFGLLQLSVLLRAYLIFKEKDARTSLAIGEMDRMPLKKKQSDGEAFVLSGHGLDEIGETSRRLKIQIGAALFIEKREHKGISQELGIYALILDDIMSDWTSRQAEMVYFLIKGARLTEVGNDGHIYEYGSQKNVALHMGVSQQTVSKLLKAAKWDLILEIINRYNYISNLFDNYIYAYK